LVLIVGLLILLVVLPVGYSGSFILLLVIVVAALVLPKAPGFALELIHEHPESSNNLNDILVVSNVLRSL
jgi:hypothetical protein